MAPRFIYLLHIASSVAFLLASPRLWKHRNRSSRRTPGWKQLCNTAIGLLLSILLAFYYSKVLYLSIPYKQLFLASLFASILATLCLSLLLWHEQQRPPRAFDLVSLYLLISIICDAGYLALPSSNDGYSIASRPILFRCCLYLAFLVLEHWPAERFMFGIPNEVESHKQLHGFFSRTFFLWINPILLRGYNTILVSDDVPPLNPEMKPRDTREAMIRAWSQRVKPETEKSLPFALMQCLKAQFYAAVAPRLLVIIFRYSQPVLIKASIRYVVGYAINTEAGHGLWLVASAVIVYVGLTLSTAAYQLRINTAKLMTRSALVGLIHAKIMDSPSVAYDDGEAATLMSSDANNLDGTIEMVHEIWAQVLEVLIGVVLLAGQVGWIWPLPLFLIYLCSHMSRFVAKRLQPRQKAWDSATQTRIGATSSVLRAMKSVKMLGLRYDLTRRIQELRTDELWAASRLRWIMVYFNASANALGIFSPAMTLVTYAVIAAAHGSSALDAETAFTTMAILSMVTHPANMVMTIVPRAVAAFSGFKRIQAFLLRPSMPTYRGSLSAAPQYNFATSSQLSTSASAVRVRQVSIGKKQSILENIDINVVAGSLTILSGPTGSGKSTLLRAILGEVEPASGSIDVSTLQIAYCAQKPWLPNRTIKDVILGAADAHRSIDQNHEAWYREVVEKCCLTHDFSTLPDGDLTQVGSGGSNLSGGQKQRVTLARALFSRCTLLLLDDIFSGLDGRTEQNVFENLFGTSGIARHMNITTVLVSNSSQYFQFADHIVVLEDGRITDQGNWQNIKAKAAAIAKFSSNHLDEESPELSAQRAKLSAQLRAKDEIAEDLARQTGDLTLYWYYSSFIASRIILFLVASTASYAFFITVPQYWLRLWTEVGNRNTAFYVGGFLFLSFMSWISTSIQMWSVVIHLAPQSGERLHRRLLHIIMSAPLSYFSKTDNSFILNRFSQDIQLIDRQLPSAFQAAVTQIFKLIMQVVLLCTAEPLLAFSLPVCSLLVYMVQRVYLRTSRQLRFLELEARAAVFMSFLESIEGLETIRSFGWSNAAVQDNVSSIEEAQRPEFLLMCLQRWLNLVLDLLAAAVVTSVVATAVVFRGRISGAQVGIALNIMLVANTTLLKLVENWVTVESSLSAIARLKTLEETTPCEDNSARDLVPVDSWPSRGQIEFKRVYVSYESGPVALRNVSFSVNAGQKVVVCGRTGSGKSTLLLTLLGLVEPQSGKIELDGVDIQHVKLDVIRQRCFIAVSQDPLLLPNETLRFNLDPDGSAVDDVLITALTKVGLWSIFIEGDETHEKEKSDAVADVTDFGERPILERKLSMFRELSGGQCQLFAVCRALVKANLVRSSGAKPVILLDEVTSSLDSVTESSIHRIVDDEFTQKGHTVIIVAHRLGGLEEYLKKGRDAIVLMLDGQVQDVIGDVGPAAFRRFKHVEQ